MGKNEGGGKEQGTRREDVHVQVNALVCTAVCRREDVHVHVDALVCTDVCMCRLQTCTDIHTYTHARTHAHVRARTHTRIKSE